jgi:hypothetical protein
LAELIEGKQSTIDEHNAKLTDDPMTGVLGELGFGTQVLPVSGADIQDEKILGTCHLATGRDDHLGGHITPAKFKRHQNATHDDILFARIKRRTLTSNKPACTSTASPPSSTSTSSRRSICWMRWRMNRKAA